MNEKINNSKNRSNGTLTEQELKNSLVYFNNLCPYSNTPLSENDWHLEHIIPVIMGGTTDSWNCIAVCGPCNLSKGGKHLLDWWDLNNSKEEEFKLEKIFNYIIEQLNKPRNFQITTKDKEYIDSLVKKEQEVDNLQKKRPSQTSFRVAAVSMIVLRYEKQRVRLSL